MEVTRMRLKSDAPEGLDRQPSSHEVIQTVTAQPAVYVLCKHGPSWYGEILAQNAEGVLLRFARTEDYSDVGSKLDSPAHMHGDRVFIAQSNIAQIWPVSAGHLRLPDDSRSHPPITDEHTHDHEHHYGSLPATVHAHRHGHNNDSDHEHVHGISDEWELSREKGAPSDVAQDS